MHNYLQKKENCSFLFIKLTPNAGCNKVDGIIVDEQNQQYLKVYTTAIPEDNKANKQLIKIISKHLKIAKNKIVLESGNKSRYKILKINDIIDLN